jgi:hypothetical protein
MLRRLLERLTLDDAALAACLLLAALLLLRKWM